ncbi:hypothetical protein Q4555_14950 [Octadecabacter sp. 1_MG-2023]|uniref:hypothetical protein n=1 Tax=unclassified Octadecabacter TaxID=196158 RepID=UPI001C09EDC8|nr:MULTISPECIES: hypothetical protein [unclassified Octadecabacter]MBU2992001.1 hypothetical protein [Octadecabacter sp. B2R22]MDO6735975.1 hypothetical protein [Octadecabacter sp. 1_MG-2023]
MSYVTASNATPDAGFCPSLKGTCAKNAFFARINALEREVYVDKLQQSEKPKVQNIEKDAHGRAEASLVEKVAFVQFDIPASGYCPICPKGQPLS